MPIDQRELDEDELSELEKTADEAPCGWRPSLDPEIIQAIEAEAGAPEKVTEGLPSVTDASDLEEARLDAAAQRLKKIEWLKPEKWAQLDTYEKVVALNTAGRELSKVYDHPKPPLLVKDMRDPDLLGTYGDGYRFNSDTGEIEGAEYGITMNRAGEVDYEKLLGDDPAVALQTYAHEFRHGYQWEQASLCDSPQLFKRVAVDDPDRARQWADNLPKYISAPSREMAESDPQRYLHQLEAYQNQPVERDATDFAKKLVRRVYG
ncbi:MAG: hypothetical protein ACFFGP_14245 [Promethearchaeota archaeon]